VGLPSQLNFSLSQGTKNIEGYNIDGTPNTYQIIAADRSGNPVPTGTSINFVAEGGQVEAIKQTQLVNGIARTTANFVSSEPRPVDGRVTITAYALARSRFSTSTAITCVTNWSRSRTWATSSRTATSTATTTPWPTSSCLSQ